MREFGFTNPVLIAADNTIIAGHGRVLAAQSLGLESVPCIRLEHLTDEQRRAYVIADNKLALNSGWDISVLKAELLDLQSLSFDIELTGFDAVELGALLAPELPPPPPGDPDVIPDAAETRCKSGDVWVMGPHRLICGDATNIEHVERLMDGARADVCFTSPPYNAGSLDIASDKGTGKKYNSFDDNKTEDEYRDFLFGNLACMFAVADEVFYNIGLVEKNKRVIIDVMHQYREQFKDIIYWKKCRCPPHIVPGVINNLVEFILCFGQPKHNGRAFKKPQFDQGTYFNVIEGANASANEYHEVHKATFPVYLPENIIGNFAPPKGNVIDCFGGTGTTLIACERLGRRCFTLEIDPKYCDIILERWETLTGKQAVRHDGESETRTTGIV